MATSAVKSDHEVPGRLHDRQAGRSRRGSLDRLRFGKGQHQDAGGQDGPLPRRTRRARGSSRSRISQERRPRQLSRAGQSRASGAKGSKSSVVCDALILDSQEPQSDTYPYIEIDENDVTIGHEASVSQDRRGATLLSDEPRTEPSPRPATMIVERLHRAAGKRAADGIRRRDEQAHPTPDGRLGGVSSRTRSSEISIRSERMRRQILPEIKSRPDLEPDVSVATDLLERELGASAATATADWSLTHDSRHRELIELRVSDWTGSVSYRFAPDELKDQNHMQYRLHRLWGDLLMVRSHVQMDGHLGPHLEY